MTAFYKTNHPAVMAAVEAMSAEIEALFEAGKAFGGTFGGFPMYSSSSHGRKLAGLVPSPKHSTVLWTVPDRHGMQRPRKKPLPKATAEQREEHATLIARWQTEWPKREVSYDAVFDAIGTNWGANIFSAIGWFEHDGWFYVETRVKLNDRMTEILGSEYSAAKAGAA